MGEVKVKVTTDEKEMGIGKMGCCSDFGYYSYCISFSFFLLFFYISSLFLLL